MVLLRIVLVGAAVIGVLALAKQQDWYERAGVTGHCTIAAAPAGETGQWWVCHQGLLTGFPTMPEDHCDVTGYVGGDQLWQCTTPINAAPNY